MVHLLDERGCSRSHLSQAFSALKLLFVQVLGRADCGDKIPRPKRLKTLPVVMSVEEVERLVRSLANVKHRTMLQVLYGTGLRVSELIGLRLGDLDSDRNTISVRCGKGAKDRQVPLSPTLLQLLREYWKAYRPEEFLFENGRSGAQMSERTVQAVFDKARAASGISKKISAQTLRHSYASGQRRSDGYKSAWANCSTRPVSTSCSPSPHVHCVVPGGGVLPDGSWKSARKGFFIPVRVMSAMFRGKFLAALQQMRQTGGLEYHGSAGVLAQNAPFKALVTNS